MSIDLLYGCFQIELSVRDLDVARAFMQEVLFAGPIEERLAREIGSLFPAGGYRVDHLDCGQATFQLNEPSPELTFGGNKSVHQGFLGSRRALRLESQLLRLRWAKEPMNTTTR